MHAVCVCRAQGTKLSVVNNHHEIKHLKNICTMEKVVTKILYLLGVLNKGSYYADSQLTSSHPSLSLIPSLWTPIHMKHEQSQLFYGADTHNCVHYVHTY